MIGVCLSLMQDVIYLRGMQLFIRFDVLVTCAWKLLKDVSKIIMFLARYINRKLTIIASDHRPPSDLMIIAHRSAMMCSPQ